MSQAPKITRVVNGKVVAKLENHKSKSSRVNNSSDVSIKDWKKILISELLVDKCQDFETEFKAIDPSKIPPKFSIEIQKFINDVNGIIADWNEADLHDIKEGRPPDEEANIAAIQVISAYAFQNAVNGVLKLPSAEYVHAELTKINYERIRNNQKEIKVMSERQCSNILKIYRNL